MEDQPADSGDLTTDPQRKRRWSFRRNKTVAPQPDPKVEAAADTVVPEEPAPRVPTGKSRRTPKPAPVSGLETEQDVAEPPATEREVTESDPTEPEADPTEPESETAETEPQPEPVLVPHRPAGKRLLTAAAAASVLFVGAAAFAGATLQPYLADRAAVDTKLDIARTAAEAITTLWSYTPDDMASLPDRSSRYLAGDFATEYRRYIDAIVSTNQQAKVTNQTQVMGTAVESLTPTEATALVYTNSVSTSPVSKNVPSLRYLSYRLTMERDGSDWLITGMNAVTKLDLTPQI
ncbi:mammalian cell entry protein [Mycolicibacterium litorale]|uniref:Mammalian cell entry protein n=1 Tax=Mycolicibacterium litorale TaxID=758802 RepID=A0AAD1IP17_9MYCO|nr:mammalian cell entry protein [Mycolicibacterium litorale]MCV7417238.1 mammalian cell entry protein [Mycolicibacterium litorale]TDY05026.1 Mce-associated membrane protein [Mycolicibacterium litorale]BBY18456.1 mammalian cell entry protein [Mycolicibacterium litorale]